VELNNKNIVSVTYCRKNPAPELAVDEAAMSIEHYLSSAVPQLVAEAKGQWTDVCLLAQHCAYTHRLRTVHQRRSINFYTSKRHQIFKTWGNKEQS